ncbi:spherulin-2A-like [Pieris brassicae]|uniref:Spherulin-2A n=1 Tax=Pieris brassicae TaxID=7116 RepID=A0A9P0U1I0_PIEBR|nr:spherulin-2A-like [Pieris brassicae]CAH4037566.1 unnamed protein product [Pieris brassicae]
MLEKTLLIICIVLPIISAKISINVSNGNNVTDVRVEYSGYDIHVINNEDIKLFKINQLYLKEAVRRYYKVRPQSVYLKSPTPWNDLYKTNDWEQVSRILSVKSATLKLNNKQNTVVLSQDFENYSNSTIKVNTALSQSVENSISTSWSVSKEWSVSQQFEYDVNVIFAKIAGTTGFTWTSNWGKNEEKSETFTIGATSSVETELKPGQAVTAILTGNKRVLEIEVVYAATLRGNVAVNFKKSFRGHYFYGPSIVSVLNTAGMDTEKLITENIKIGVYIDHSLKVFDKTTGLPL